jgi:hypothetical protein
MRGCGQWTKGTGKATKSSKMVMFISVSSIKGERKEKVKESGLKLAKYTKESGTKE